MADATLEPTREPHGGLALVVLDTYDDPDVASLRLVRSEVASIAELLQQIGFTEVAEDLVGDDGRSLSLRQSLADWRPTRRRVLLYWVGHGRAGDDGDIWLYGQDTGRDPVSSITMSGRVLGQILAEKAIDQVVLILDACQAGVGAHVITGAFASAIAKKGFPGPRKPSLAVITSAGPAEYAREGVFAPALIQLLRDGPPEDPSQTWWTEHDEYIDLPELAAALQSLLDRNKARQLPDHYMQGAVIRFLRNPHHIAYSPDVEVEAGRRRGAMLPKDVLEHFMLKFRGIDTADERGWYFTGREQPLREIVEWLGTARSGLLLVTGPPGCGKSAILGRLAVLSDEGYRREAEEAGALESLTPDTDPGVDAISAGIHAKNKTLLDCIGELADALDLPVPPNGWHNISELLAVLGDRKHETSVLLDALDEARPADVLAIARDLLRGLANLPRVRVVVGTRTGLSHAEQSGSDDGAGEGSPLLRALAADRLVRLEEDPEAVVAVADYAEQRLRDVPGSPYASQPKAARATAEAVARHSEGIFLFGRLLARTLARRAQVLDLSSAEAQQLLSGSVADSFAADLERYGDDERRVRDLLVPLAWTEGAGLPRRQVWLALANAFTGGEAGRHYEEGDLGWLLEHAGAYLIQSGEDGQTVYRLYHQAFNDHLRHGQDPAAAHGIITDALVALAVRDGIADWPNANPYLHRHLATHAAAAGRLAPLVADSRYLLYADPLRLARVLGGLDHRQHTLARLYWRALDRLREAAPAERAQILQATALDSEPGPLPLLQTDIELPWRGRWASGPATPFHRRLTGHLALVQAVAIGRLDGRAVVVSGGNDQTVRVWDAATGEPEAVLTGHSGSIQSVAVSQAGSPAVIASGGDDTVCAWDPDSGEQRWVAHDDNGVLAVTIGSVDDDLVVVAGGNDQTVRVWDAHTGAPRSSPSGHTAAVRAVTLCQVDGQAVLVSAGDDGTIRTWNAHTGEERQTLERPADALNVLTLGQLDGQPVIVASDDDHTIRIWNAHSGQELQALDRSTDAPIALTLGQLDGQPVIVATSDDHTVHIWDPHSGDRRRTLNRRPAEDEVQPRKPRKRYALRAVATGELDGRPVIVSGGEDGVVRVWDAGTGAVRRTLGRHTDAVDAVAIGQLDGRPVIVSGGRDKTIRVWDALGDQEPIYGHAGAVRSVAIGQLGGRSVVVSGGDDQTVRVWAQEPPDPTGRARSGFRQLSIPSGFGSVKALAVGAVDGRPTIVSGGNDQTVRIWDAYSGRQRRTLDGHAGSVNTLAFETVAGRPTIVSGGTDRTIRIWDADTGEQRALLRGHADSIQSVAIGEVEGTPVVVSVSGGTDRTIRIWDAETRDQRAVLRSMDAVLAVAFGSIADRPVVVSGGRDHTIRIWDADTREQQPVPGDLDNAVLAVAFGWIAGEPVVVSGGNDRTVRVWDADSGDLRSELTGPQEAALGIAVAEIDDRAVIVAAGGYDRTVYLWDAATGDPPATLSGPEDAALGVAVGQVGDGAVIVAAGGYDRAAYVWDAVTGDLQATLSGADAAVQTVAVGEIGGQPVVVAGVEDGTVCIWDVGRLWESDSRIDELRPDLLGQTDAVQAVAIGRIGDQPVIVSGTGDGTVYVWDPDGEDPLKPLAELTGHTAMVQAVAIGQIGDRPVIVSAGGTDQTVRLWDAETFQPRLALSGHATDAHAVAVGEVGGRAMIFVGAQERVQAVEVLRLPGGVAGPG